MTGESKRSFSGLVVHAGQFCLNPEGLLIASKFGLQKLNIFCVLQLIQIVGRHWHGA